MKTYHLVAFPKGRETYCALQLRRIANEGVGALGGRRGCTLLPGWGALPSLLPLQAGKELGIFPPEFGGEVARSAHIRSKRGHPALGRGGSRVPCGPQAGCGGCWLWLLSGGLTDISIPPVLVCFKKAKPSCNNRVPIAGVLAGRGQILKNLPLRCGQGLLQRLPGGGVVWV